MTPLLDNVLQKTCELNKDTAIIPDTYNFTEVWQKQPKQAIVAASSHIKKSNKFVQSQSIRMVKAWKKLTQASALVEHRAMDQFSPNVGKVSAQSTQSKKIRSKINLTKHTEIQTKFGSPINIGNRIKIVPVTRASPPQKIGKNN